MAEIETLTVDEPLAERIERHNFDRLLMLSDGVFAIAITLLVLELRPPEHWQGGLDTLMAAMERPLFSYSAGFVIIALYWIVHRRLFARLRRVDAVATTLALSLLFLIALVPAVSMLISQYSAPHSMLVYVLMVAAIGIVQFALWTYSALIVDLADRSLDRRARVNEMLKLAVPALGFGILAGAGFAGVDISNPLPLLLTILPIAALRRWLSRRSKASV